MTRMARTVVVVTFTSSQAWEWAEGILQQEEFELNVDDLLWKRALKVDSD